MTRSSLPHPGRQPVYARNAIATSQPLASAAGASAFAQGGNAVDAVLAAAITLTVVEPTMNGIGGDAFALIWQDGQLHGLNGSGRAPRGWSPERFAGRTAMPERGWDTVTVPGAVATWVDLHARFGTLPFETLFRDAVRHASEGFPVSPNIARQWEQARIDLTGQPGFEAFLVDETRAPREGELWRFPAQADTLREIARTRGESFYRGPLAQRIAAAAAAAGAALTQEDLASHRTEWVAPISKSFRDVTVHELPPNGQGLAALIALGILAHLPYDQTEPGSAQRAHLEIEALRLAFADLYAHVSDPDHMRVAPEALLDEAYLRQRAELVDPRHAGTYPPGQPPSGGTVYLCAADASGMMVSYIQSNYQGFGSGVVIPDTGIALHNRGRGFTLAAGHPNQVAGGKRPLHSIIPAFLTRAGKPLMAFGVMGGNMQAQGHMQMVLRYVVEGRNPQASSDVPRWRIGNQGELMLEPEWPEAVIDALKAMGHVPHIEPWGTLEFGSAQLIACTPDRAERAEHSPVYVAGSDHRRDGHAIGY